MPDVTENERIAGDVFYGIYVRSHELAEQYAPIVSEFTNHPSCFGCLVNAIMSLLYHEREVSGNTVMLAYKAEASNHAGIDRREDIH